jgi:catechol-2,3-dioxygenase
MIRSPSDADAQYHLPLTKEPVMDKPVTPRGINHLVLNVRDIEESHRFWTEIVGFRQVGELKRTATRPNPPKMRF